MIVSLEFYLHSDPEINNPIAIAIFIMNRPAIHPGGILADELEEIGVNPIDLANEIHISTTYINQIINGQQPITADLALRLGQWFGISPEFLLNLQKSYELRLAQQQMGEEIQKTIQRRKVLLN